LCHETENPYCAVTGHSDNINKHNITAAGHTALLQ